ncbi:hypothetical protein [Rhodanobacter sp. MP1X3]|uniref:hypothetical protein n=1 Tax=Rhodanobacter sp. MP1X3 TaxID=2723086 RepID=UPI00160D585F|nr:hypothetical protein [Rhodanobacter sp. MP1X3]MBB6244859.1 hypothetical protein [Rhodanobacter sp. MP1X3]
MRNDCWRWLASTLLGSFIYLGHAAVGYSQTRAQNIHPIAPTSASTAAVTPDDTLEPIDQRNWRSFLKLAAKPNAMITPEDVESAFEQKVIHNERTDEYDIRGVLKYFESETPRFRNPHPDRKRIGIIFIFQDKDFFNRCPSRSQFVSDLRMAGWTLLHHAQERDVPDGIDNNHSTFHLPARDTFLKGDQGIIHLTYPNGCPDVAHMDADKLEFDRITRAPASEDL